MALSMGIARAVAGIVLLAAASPLPGQDGRGAAPPRAEAKDPVVARGQGLTVVRSELIPLLLDRYAMSRDGRDLLKLLVSSRLIDRIAGERGLEVSEAEVAALWDDLDRRARGEEDGEGLGSELARRGLAVEEFRDYLRLSLLQEKLTRLALGLAEDAPVSGDQQEIWLEQEMKNRGLLRLPPPWADGIVARCGAIEITREELGEALLDKMNAEDVRETCWHLLLLKGIERRMPDLAPSARREAVDREMERRRAKSEAANETKGVGFEEILAARGSSVEMLRRDPAVHIAALSRLWVDKVEGPEGVRAEYVANRDFYEGRYGKSVHTYLIFLVASQYKNELNPRTFEEAAAELEKLKADIVTLREFTAVSARTSEEPTIRQSKGDLGWLTSGDPRYPAQIRDAVFDFLGSGGKVSAAGSMLGPVRLDTGMALLWLSAVKESPPWEEMAENVHEELRRRFIDDVMPAKAVEMVLR